MSADDTAAERDRVAIDSPAVGASIARWRGAARAALNAGRPADAVAPLDRVLDQQPSDVDTRLELVVALSRSGDADRADAELRLARMQYRQRPVGWSPMDGKKIAALLQRIDGDADTSIDPAQPMVTILVGGYGDHAGYTVRALASIVADPDFRRHFSLLIGLNACCAETVHRARALTDAGLADGVVESRTNRNKDPIWRTLLSMVQTPYLLWMDDDSHFISATWSTWLAEFVRAEHPFDAAGQHACWGPFRHDDPGYHAFIAKRPWFRSAVHQPAPLRRWLPFPLGGLFLARTAFLRRHDFPDAGMTKAMDDVALGELLQQVGGRLVPFSAEILAMLRINDGVRRGEAFLLPDGITR